jgi:hypothetical protein
MIFGGGRPALVLASMVPRCNEYRDDAIDHESIER